MRQCVCGNWEGDMVLYCGKCGRRLEVRNYERTDGNLWSWLFKSSKRSHYLAEGKPRIAESQYASMVQSKLNQNKIPAIVEKANIEWDINKEKREVYRIRPTENQAVNALTCTLHFNYVGDYAFVDTKTFITPPDLPPFPGKEVPEEKGASSLTIWGIGMLLFGTKFVGGVALFVGLILASIGGYSLYKYYNAITANKEVREQRARWSAAWKNWEERTLLFSYQEISNGEIGRVYEAVQDSIGELNKMLFAGEPTEVEKETVSMNQLEEMIARRKDEYR